MTSKKDKDGKKKGSVKKTLLALEKRLMYDATLSGLAASVTFNENTINTTPTQLDTAVTIGGSTTNFNGINFTVSTDGGADDQLSVRNQGTAAGQIAFRNSIVSYGGVAIGTVGTANGIDGGDLTITLNASATQAGLEALIENITYRNQDDTPLAARTLTYTLEGLFSQTMTVNITAQNDAPIIGSSTGARIAQGATITIYNNMLYTTDAENGPGSLTYRLTAQSQGNLRLNGVNIAINGTFTQSDIDNGNITFVHNNTANNSSFTYTVTDGTATTAATVFTLTRDTSNTAPALDPQTAISYLDPSVSYYSGNGNFYKYVNSSVDYDTAYKLAASTYLNGVAGHLVTITSSGENAHVRGLIGNTVWIAASDVAVEGEWRWTAGPEK